MIKEYITPRVGQRVTIATKDEMLVNIGEGRFANAMTNREKDHALTHKVPAGFTPEMNFLIGQSGVLVSQRRYRNSVDSIYLRNTYERDSFRTMHIRFDDIDVNRRSEQYRITNVMLKSMTGLCTSEYKGSSQFAKSLGKSSKWGESYTSEKENDEL